MGKILKIMQAIWGFIGSKALLGAASSLMLPIVTVPWARQILEYLEKMKISNILGIQGNPIIIELFVAVLCLSVAFMAGRIDEEEF
jgi:hypothetical protein